MLRKTLSCQWAFCLFQLLDTNHDNMINFHDFAFVCFSYWTPTTTIWLTSMTLPLFVSVTGYQPWQHDQLPWLCLCLFQLLDTNHDNMINIHYFAFVCFSYWTPTMTIWLTSMTLPLFGFSYWTPTMTTWSTSMTLPLFFFSYWIPTMTTWSTSLTLCFVCFSYWTPTMTTWSTSVTLPGHLA